MTLRDALADTLGDVDYMNWRPDEVARLVLERPAFRAALTEAIGTAFMEEHGWEVGYKITVGGAADALDSMAAAIVARMLGEP